MPASLTLEQNERLRVAMRELLARFDSNQTRLGEKLGISQAAVSAFLSRRQGSSFRIAGIVAHLLGRDVEEILGVREGDSIPERTAAVKFARANNVRADAIEWALSQPSAPFTPEQWYERIKVRALELNAAGARVTSTVPPATKTRRMR